MNSITGKSTGIALLMAAALLAALFAMGVFSATGVFAAEPSFDGYNYDADGDATNETFRFTILKGSDGDLQDSVDGELTGEDKPVKVGTIKAVPGTGDSAIEYTFTGGTAGTNGNVGHSTVTGFRINNSTGQIDYIGDDFQAANITLEVVATSGERDATTNAFSAGGAPNDKTAPVHVIPYVSAGDNSVPGKAVRVTIEANMVVARRGVITVDMPKFGLPASMPTVEVEIQDSNSEAVRTGTPRSISISGTKVLLTLGDLTSGSGNNEVRVSEIEAADSTPITITFYPSAGITNPTADGKYEVTVSTAGVAASVNSQREAQVVVVNRQVSVNPKKGGRGSEITINGKGFSSGEATVFIDNGKRDGNLEANVSRIIAENAMYDRGLDKVLGRATITSGSFTLTMTVGDSDQFAGGSNTINAIDSAGSTANKDNDATFTVSGSIDADPKEISFSEEVDIMLEDWDYVTISKVTFGGSANVATVTAISTKGGVTTVTVTVPPGIRPGTHQVKVTGSKIGSGSQTINIVVNPLALTVEPESAVPGQQVTVKGSGFSGGEDVVMKVNGEPVSQKAVSGSAPETNTSGNLNVTFSLPDAEDLDTGEATITAEEETSKRTGQVKVTIPKPTITLDPASSGYGSTVTVSGSGFPASESLDIEYFNIDDDDFEPVGISRSDSTGNFNGSFDVPGFAQAGKANDVRVIDRDSIRKATETHTLPKESISADPPEVSSGGTITINGANLPLHTTVSDVMIGRTDVTPSPKPITNADGAVSITVVVPQLQLGNQPISITIADNVITDSVKIVVPTVATSGAPADVFADLIADGSLSTVWHLDAATQGWTSFSTNPALADFNDLTMIQGGQVYVLIMSAAGEFNGAPLYVGTNQVYIN